jgi:diketogulonate reductase-like aldo/keto reductase
MQPRTPTVHGKTTTRTEMVLKGAAWLVSVPSAEYAQRMAPTRREVLKGGVAAGALAVSTGLELPTAAATESGAGAAALVTPPSTRRGDMLYRTLGTTGVEVSLIGLGGHHIGRPSDEDAAIRLIRSAIDRGITFMDNCWDYHGGGSERRMGKALRDGYRDKVFLMSKIDGRTKDAAAQQIDASLSRLQTDRVDLMQHHEVIRMEDPDRIFAPGGAQEAMREAQRAGKVRFVGFTGHKDPLVHLRMLEVADQHGTRFDTVQMPLNVMDAHFRSFQHHVLPVLVQRGIGVLGMKSMGDQIILSSGVVRPIECLHYAMNLPTSVVITGIESPAILDQAFEAARTFAPLDAHATAALLARTAALAATGRYELFKTSNHFDGTAKNPAWLG